MTEPTERQTAVRGLVVRQLAHHLTLRTRVRKHVDEIEHDDIQGCLRTFELMDDAFAEIALVDLPIVKTLAAAIAVQQRLDKFLLMLVLTLFIAFFHPVLREHLLDLQRQETGENRITGILGSRRKNRGILLFRPNGIELAQKRLDGLPLVITEIINHAQQHFLPFVQQRKDGVLHQVMGHDRMRG